ncbi:MAG: zinc ABC transporter substrate-binding protein [Muribaculaceae bacterium]|nr:zinc ABC transporter substrate-binding protein [Muribaculaceae bacterium]
MKRLLSYITVMCALAGCGPKSQTTTDSAVLTVSIEPQRKMLEELAGDRYRVVTLLVQGADPENYEPTMTQRVDLSRSAALFTVGHLPFEDVLARSVGEGTMVVDTSEGVEVLTGTHSHGHGEGHDEADPHVWTSLRNGKTIAANMLDALVRLDPENAGEYRERYENMAARLDSIDRVLVARFEGSGDRAFAIWHPSLSYFARDYGLHQIAVGQENREVSASRIKEIISEARADSVKVFFAQQAYDTRQASTISEEMGAGLVTVDPLAYDWESEIIHAADALTH